MTAHTRETSASTSWMHLRLERASDALDRAFDEGLTGHTILGRQGKRVRLDDGSDAVEFVSCSYLGLETHPKLIEAAHRALNELGLHLSSSRNRMRPRYLGVLEGLLREIYTGSPVAVFTSTSSVHLGVLPLLGANGLPGYPITGTAEFLVDRTAHASMQVLRGIFEQIGPTSRIDVTDPTAVDERLAAVRRAGNTPIVLVDGVGSMSGLVPVAELADCLQRHGGYLYVDDAHGVSIDGAAGAGWAFTALGGQLPDNVVLAGSLSKAFGGSGGFAVVKGDADMRALRKSANPLVFGHSIMLPMLAADVASAELHLSGDVQPLQDQLWSNIARFDSALTGRVLNEGLRSPVRGVRFEREVDGLAAARRLRAEGIIMLPAFYPTVEQGSALLRFAISALHSADQIDRVALAIGDKHTTALADAAESFR